MKKKYVIMIGLAVVVLYTVPVVNASMATATLDIGPFTYSGSNFSVLHGSTTEASVSGIVQPEAGSYAEFGPEFASFSYLFSVQPEGNLSMSLPYVFTGYTTTQNLGDSAWARMSVLLDVTQENPDGGPPSVLAYPGYQMDWGSNDGLPGYGENGEGVLTAYLENSIESSMLVGVSCRGYVMMGAFTSDTATVVPVPGASLLAFIGLSVSGVKLRKYA